MLTKGKYCHGPNDIPKTKHWAILETGSYSKEEDYGFTSHYYTIYIAFTDKKVWHDEIVERTQENLNPRYRGMPITPFVAVEVNPAEIQTSVSINIGL